MSAFCANCVVGEHGLHWRRFDDDAFFRIVCDDCDPPDVPVVPHARSPKYFPLDVALQSMAVRIVRAVRRFDWATAGDLSDALGIPGKDIDREVRNNFDVSLSRQYRIGNLRRQDHCYQITDQGRGWLEGRTTRLVDMTIVVR